MKKILIIVAASIITACHGWTTGTVVDNKTSRPIEGAIVYVDWNITKGLPGLSYTQDYKIVEIVTDSNGEFTIPGILNPFPHIENITVYKKGYIAWNNREVFPKDIYSTYDGTYKKESSWRENHVIKLNEFQPDHKNCGHIFTHHEHKRFIDSVTEDGIQIRKAAEWEGIEAAVEEHIKIPINLTGSVVDAETGQPIEGAIGLVTGQKCNVIMVNSDKDGKIKIVGDFPLINPPSFIVYKEGYIVWDHKCKFPSHWASKHDFLWQNDYVFKLGKWKSSYSRNQHIEYIMNSVNSIGYYDCDKDKYNQAKTTEKKFREIVK